MVMRPMIGTRTRFTQSWTVLRHKKRRREATRGETRNVEARQWAKVTARQQASDGVAIGGGPQIEQSAGKQQ
jgi:hypothetical protein